MRIPGSLTTAECIRTISSIPGLYGNIKSIQCNPVDPKGGLDEMGHPDPLFFIDWSLCLKDVK